MSDIYLDFRTANQNIDPEQQVESTISHMGSLDTLNIAFDPGQAHASQNVYRILQANGFAITPKGGSEDNAYSLIARRIH